MLCLTLVKQLEQSTVRQEVMAISMWEEGARRQEAGGRWCEGRILMLVVRRENILITATARYICHQLLNTPTCGYGKCRKNR